MKQYGVASWSENGTSWHPKKFFDTLEEAQADLERLKLSRRVRGRRFEIIEREVSESRKKENEMTDQEFLTWLHDRLIHVYQESENVDFVKRFEAFIDEQYCGRAWPINSPVTIAYSLKTKS